MNDSDNLEKIEEEKQNNTPQGKAKQPFVKSLLEQVEIVVILFAVIILIFSFVCKTCRVDGDSMVDTLHNNELVLIWDLGYTPKTYDIVVIHDNDTLNKPIVKRIIGVPGDTVYIEHYFDSMKVVITRPDGTSVELVEEYTYFDGGSPFLYLPQQEFKVEEGQVFVMGDNRFDSNDSRKLGCYDIRQILGKVVLRITPFNKFGTVN